MIFVPTSYSVGCQFEPSTSSQPAQLGEKVEQQGYAGPKQAVLGIFPVPGSP